MSSIFKNRWMAVLWAAGIVWFAYDFAQSPPQDQTKGNVATDETGAPVSADDQNKVAQTFGN